jgi:histidine triad (HIT) family protein
MGHMFEVVQQLAAKWHIVRQGYRLTVNVGRGGGQEVDHIHMHMVSGWTRRS